jgi:hypothetical protein
MLGSLAEVNRHGAPGNDAMKEERNFRAIPAAAHTGVPERWLASHRRQRPPYLSRGETFHLTPQDQHAEVEDAKLDFQYCF